MFQSFTGNSRRPRQVNLGGRTTNPFATYQPGTQDIHRSSIQSTLAIAQQERAVRQQEREKLWAGRLVQRVWRGYRSRKLTRTVWRAEWDNIERQRGVLLQSFEAIDGYLETGLPYATAEECLSQLRLLVQFVEAWNYSDIARLVYFSGTLQRTLQEMPSISAAEGSWTMPLDRLARLALRVLRSLEPSRAATVAMDHLLQLLVFLTDLIPKRMARLAREYYTALATLTKSIKLASRKASLSKDYIVQSVLALLRPVNSETLTAYGWFAKSYLVVPDLVAYLGTLDELTNNINYKLLTLSLSSPNTQADDSPLGVKEAESRLWLLSHFIYFHRYALGSQETYQTSEPEFAGVVSELLNSVAVHVSQSLEMASVSDIGISSDIPLHPFVKDQISSLVNQASITGLFSKLQCGQYCRGQSQDTDSEGLRMAETVASYALTLLRVFPRRGDDIRMWIYLASAASSDKETGQTGPRIPVIKIFWQISKSSNVFYEISQDSAKVLPLLKPENGRKDYRLSGITRNERDGEWIIVLLFLELYTFALKVMDDEEFFSACPSFTAVPNERASWTRESALPLADIKNMTVFLKNLAFTLYWNSADLSGTETSHGADGIRGYFNSSSPVEPTMSARDLEAKRKGKGLPGVVGIPLDYFKGLVTGLLRMIHERDSRRRFLPDGHWLMTTRFDMEGFIPTVVAEEEKRHQLQDEDEDENGDDLTGDDLDPSLGLAGTVRTQQARSIEALRRRQQRTARRKQLESVAPRLEILRNVPFFIPFHTRVQIFREFIYRDQMRRRQGFIDSDAWRLSVAHASLGLIINGQPAAQDILRRHHANIRRENVFDDAFNQFYDLGEGIKEPIQITFIDKFNTVEAGIDGGGVTKEFLTSITNEAFKSDTGLHLFEENEQHLLYPNPAAVEQRKELLRRGSFTEQSAEWNEQIRGLLQRYEFLGRTIGKCLYEGILVDVEFAPFFLLKWALTGGTGSAQKETAYRANLNDLKDLDQRLYQGLLQLKNYPGDVEDFSLNFTVTDTIPVPGETSGTITRDLKGGGSEIPVTNQNRLVYISYIARYRLQAQPALQTNAFLQGLGQVIQPSWLSMFNQSELQTLVSGDSGDIDVSDLRQNTLYGGVYAIGDDNQEHPTIKIFWEVMESLPNEDRQKVLRFVTSTPRAPLLGFSHLNPRFTIRDSSDDDGRLPSTSTCVNLLKLPRYSGSTVLREKLLYAVNSGAGFDLS